MADDAFYDAVVRVAGVHLQTAWDALPGRSGAVLETEDGQRSENPRPSMD
jgi:hypothetical protein